MPSLEISLPGTTDEIRAMLAAELTAVFSRSTGHPREIFEIIFHEYSPEQASTGGSLCSENGIPYLHMMLHTPKISRENKQKLAAGLTETFCRIAGNPEWEPVIHICEYPYDNIIVKGRLLSDQYEECRNSKFYYEL